MSVPLTRIRAVVAVVAMLLGLTVVVATPALASTGVTDTWTGNGDGSSWTDGANWSTDHAPNNGDSVYIAPPTPQNCSAHVDDVPSGVQLQDFTLTDAAPAAGDTCLASIDGGSISVAGTFTATGGVLSTPFTLTPGSTGTISPFTGFDTTTEFDADLTVHGVLTLDGNVPDGSTARDVSFGGAHSLTIASDGELDAVNSNVVSGTSCCVTQNHLVNNGLLKVEGGTLTISADELDQNATLEADNSAVVTTTESPATAAAGATYTGNGSWRTYQATTTTFTGTQNLGSSFQLVLGGVGSAGDDNFQGTFTLAGTGTFSWLGGTIDAAMTIAHGVTANVRGNVSSDQRYLSGGPDSANPVGITNHGVLNFTGNTGYYAQSNGGITNASDGVLYLGAGVRVSGDCCAGSTPNAVTNSGGRVVVPNASATTPVILENVSYLQTSGSTTIAAGHQLDLTGGGESQFSPSAVTGGGTLQDAASVTVSKSVSIGANTTLQLAKLGTLTSATTSAAAVGGPGALSWTGGTVGGTLKLATAGGVTVSGSNHVVEQYAGGASAITISAPATFSNGTASAANEVDFQGGSRLTLTGATTAGAFVTFDNGQLLNTGTLTVKAGTKSPLTLDDSDLTNRGTVSISGTLNSDDDYVQTAGSTNVLGALTFNGSSSARISGGVFGGRGQVGGSVINSAGQLQPGLTGIGTLTITGNYTQLPAASAQVQIGSTTNDLVSIGGTASVRGELAFVNTGFSPAIGDHRTVLTAGSRPYVAPGCVITTGQGSTAQHWTTGVSGTSLVATSVAGQQSSCPGA